MYPNFNNYRRALKYELKNDTNCRSKLVIITDTPFQLIKSLPSNVKYKTKRTIFIATLASGFWFTNLESAYAMGIGSHLPPTQIVNIKKPIYSSQSEIQISEIVSGKLDKICFIGNRKLIPIIYIDHFKDSGYINQQLVKMFRIRGGDDLYSTFSLIVIVALAYIASKLSGIDAFAMLHQVGRWNAPTAHPQFGFDPYEYDLSKTSSSQTVLEMHKPSAMPQQNYVSLTKLERRQLADPLERDRSIDIDGYPLLELRYNQVEFKTPAHGGIYGLLTDEKGKTLRTEANALALRDSIVDISSKPDVIWYTEGMYQGGTPRGCESVNLFDPETNIIVVYQKYQDATNLFLTTCQLNQLEITHLKNNNGNFVSENVLNAQKAISTQIVETKNNNNNGLQ